MNTEFKRMMQLAGLTEIRITPPNQYNIFWQKYLDTEEKSYNSYEEELEVIKLFRTQNITSLDDLADKITDLDEEFSEIAGVYSGEFAQGLVDDIEKLCDEMNFSQKDELIDKIKANYNDFDEDDEDDEDDF